MADIQRYLDGIESQHKTKEKFMSHLARILDMIDAGTSCAADMPRKFYIHEAVGKQLDTLALYIGGDRRFPPVSIPGIPPLLTDDVFRKVLLAKIIQNRWDGTEATFQEIWENTFRDEINATYFDNQDMTVTVDVYGHIEPIMVELVLAGYIIPVPMGVGLNTHITEKVIADAEAAFPASLGMKFYSNFARIGLHYPRDPVEASAEVMQGANFFANFARIGINSDFILSGSAIFSADRTELFSYSRNAPSPAYTIPSTVTSIADYAFMRCAALKRLTIPASVTTFGAHLFDGMTGLTMYGEPGSAANSYANTNSITFAASMDTPDFTVPAIVTEIDDEAFEGISASVVTMSDSVTSIGSRAFAECPNLRQIYIPAETTIANDAFEDVSGLTIFGTAGSPAETFAAAHSGITFAVPA